MQDSSQSAIPGIPWVAQSAIDDERFMRAALELAGRGAGFVEPNPIVGCVIVQAGEIVGEGWHRRFGGPHAEIEALAAAGERARGAAMYITLEPCCHTGKTPPCTKAILAAGIARVVAAMADPFPQVAGGGFAQLQAAGVSVESGLLEEEARALNAPYLKLLTTGRPWVIAKWAMSLDGKLAAAGGDSRWISGEASRAVVHSLRGRMDAIIVGRGTALADDPQLTARPAGPRVATRIVLDSRAELPPTSHLARTARETPVLVAIDAEAAQDPQATQRVTVLQAAGCEIIACAGETHAARFETLLDELGRRRMTNLLVEGGSEVLGTLFDAQLVDEVHVFIAPRLIGGQGGPTPIAGAGQRLVDHAARLTSVVATQLDDDFYIAGRIDQSSR